MGGPFVQLSSWLMDFSLDRGKTLCFVLNQYLVLYQNHTIVYLRTKLLQSCYTVRQSCYEVWQSWYEVWRSCYEATHNSHAIRRNCYRVQRKLLQRSTKFLQSSYTVWRSSYELWRSSYEVMRFKIIDFSKCQNWNLVMCLGTVSAYPKIQIWGKISNL